MGCDTRVTVSPIGTSSGTLLPNNGADYGPDSVNPSTLALTTTSGIQEALNSIASTGGLVYLRRGAYNVSSPIQGTGSNQTVWFEPGSDLVFNMNTAPLMLLETYGLISIASNLPSSSPVNFSHVQWFGNGCVVNANGAGKSNSTNVFLLVQAGYYEDTSNPYKAGVDFVLDGFVLTNVPNASFFVGVHNYNMTPSNITYLNQIRNVRISRIHATWYSPVSGASGLVVQGSVRQCVLEDLYMDMSNIPNSVNYSNLFIRSASGDTQQVKVRRSLFLGTKLQTEQNPGSLGEVVEFQGIGAFGSSNSGWHLHELAIEDCTFDSAQPSVPTTQIGGLYLDDTNGSETGYIYNIEFRRCNFINSYWDYSNDATVFGYIRVVDSSSPGNLSGSGNLPGRWPNDPGISASITGSSYTNTDGFDEDVTAVGGVATSGFTAFISVNGASTGQSSGIFRLRTGDSLTFTNYSTLPTLRKQSR